MAQIVHPAEWKVAGQADRRLSTQSLGAGVGVALLDPGRRIGGLVHCLLPRSADVAGADLAKPAMFVDTGLAALLEALARWGVEPRRLVAAVAGAGTPASGSDGLDLADRNATAVHDMLARHGIPVVVAEMGGSRQRRLVLDLTHGTMSVALDGPRSAP